MVQSPILATCLVAACAWLAGCAPYQPPQFQAPTPPRPPVETQRRMAPAAPATLWVVNETGQRLYVYLDGYFECELAADKKCRVDPIDPGNHLLRLVRADGTTWQSPYDYAEDEMVSCFATLSDVDCLSDVDSFF